MAYYLDLFSPETYEAFGRSDQSVSGFRVRQRNAAARIKVGDKLLCYMTTLSRWFGILEVLNNHSIRKLVSTVLLLAANRYFRRY